MRRLSVLSVCTRERTPTPTRSYANWNWTMRPNEGSWLSILTQSRCVCVRLCVNVCFNDWMLRLCGDYLVSCVILLFPPFQNAESVEVDSIPLPDMPHAPSNIHIQDIPLPGAQPPSILKKSTTFGLVFSCLC